MHGGLFDVRQYRRSPLSIDSQTRRKTGCLGGAIKRLLVDEVRTNSGFIANPARSEEILAGYAGLQPFPLGDNIGFLRADASRQRQTCDQEQKVFHTAQPRC